MPGYETDPLRDTNPQGFRAPPVWYAGQQDYPSQTAPVYRGDADEAPRSPADQGYPPVPPGYSPQPDPGAPYQPAGSQHFPPYDPDADNQFPAYGDQGELPPYRPADEPVYDQRYAAGYDAGGQAQGYDGYDGYDGGGQAQGYDGYGAAGGGPAYAEPGATWVPPTYQPPPEQVPATPPPPPRGPRRPGPPLWLMLTTSLLALAAVGLAVYVVGFRNDDSQASESTTPQQQTSATSAAPPPSAGSAGPANPPSSAPPTTTAADPEKVAEAELAKIRDASLTVVKPSGQWVAQLASKYIGITDPNQVAANGSHTFYASDILAEYQAIKSGTTGANVVLLLSTDYGEQKTINGKPLYVTFAISDFADQGAVEAFCKNRFPSQPADQMNSVCWPRELKPKH